MDRVLIVDDDVTLCELLVERLGTEGFAIEAVHDGPRGLERAVSGDHALVILDLMLPGMGGLEVLRRVRARLPVAVLVLTARGADVERILGLEAGADDYLAKPFHPRELIARMRAILRRTTPTIAGTEPSNGEPRNAEPWTTGDFRLDPAAREARFQGAVLPLTSVEFTLLETLVRHAGHVVTREELTETVLGRKPAPFDRVIDVHISNIRRKLGSQGAERIKAVRNSGYLLAVRSETL